jgi:hypothetical protein
VRGKIRVAIADSPDREKTYAELSCDGEEWGIVSDEGGPLVLEIYPRADGERWILDYEDAVCALQYAKRRLSGETPDSAAAVLEAQSG